MLFTGQLTNGAVQLFARQWVVPVAISMVMVAIITVILWVVDTKLGTDHLIFIYFVPTTFIAIRYGSVSAMSTVIVSDLAAAYFLYPPKLSMLIANPLDVAELAFFTMLALLASQVVSGFANDSNVKERKR
jgi:K+-sensing histidine kinase KdpD